MTPKPRETELPDIERYEVIKKLNFIRNKGGCFFTTYRTNRAFLYLKNILPEKEYNELSIAHSHFTIGEGAGELYDVCKKLILKYQ